MSTYLKLTGVEAVTGGVINLNGANSGLATVHLLAGWAPMVAPRRVSRLGGHIYEDVVEHPALRIEGSSATECLTMLHLLSVALDQAQAKFDGANVPAVLLHYRVDGSTLTTPLQTAVLGSPANRSSLLSLQPTFNQETKGYDIHLTYPMLRRGLWLGDEDSEVSSSAEIGEVMTVTFSTGTQIVSPFDIEIAFDVTNTLRQIPPFLLFFGPSDKLAVLDIASGNGFFPNVTDSANKALGDAVIRYTPTDTSKKDNGVTSLQALGLTSRTFDIFAAVKNNSSSTNFALQANVFLQANDGFVYSTLTELLTVRGGDTDRQVVRMGSISLSDDALDFMPTVQANDASGSFDIDSFVFADIDDVIVISSLANIVTPNADMAGTFELRFAHDMLNRISPRAGLYNASGTTYSDSDIAPMSYQGNALLHAAGDSFSLLIMMTDPDNNYWRWTNGTSVMKTTATFRRRRAYLVPQ